MPPRPPTPLAFLCGLLILTSLWGCADDGTKADAGSQVLHFFQKPFTGNFRNNTPFDHDLPREDSNTFVLTWRGERIEIGWDGHNGHDWGLPDGTPVLAAAAGEVVFSGTDSCGALQVNIRHRAPNNELFETLYLHLSRIDVTQGQDVLAGEQIGLSGNTGCSSGPHLHFGVFRLAHTNSGKPTLIDPFGWQGTKPDPWAEHPQGAPSIWLWKDGQVPSGDVPTP